ncbi:MAG: rhodanese-like domain-containing protein [Acidimicrobiales bacterium]|nr:rhodanese-like domain-containing protein [Actinomycetota bacterium]
MFRTRRTYATASLLAVVVLLVALTSCGSEAGGAEPATTDPTATPAPGKEAAAAAKAEGRTVIDVRTPEEYDAGHVEGATLVNFQDPGFADAIAALDPDGSYVVYCRSGNRSAQAAKQMTAIGLDVIDGGGLPDMVDAGWPTA